MQIGYRNDSVWQDDRAFALASLRDHVSYSGWAFAMVAGLVLWALMFRFVI